MLDIYGLDETAGTWRQKAAALAADVVARHATDVDTNARFPSESMAALAQGDFYGLCIDARFGGQGQGPATFAAVVEELARHCGSTAMVYVMHIAATKVIETSVTLPTRADVLRSICCRQASDNLRAVRTGLPFPVLGPCLAACRAGE